LELVLQLDQLALPSLMQLREQFVVLVQEELLLLAQQLLVPESMQQVPQEQRVLAHHSSKYLGELPPWASEVFRRVGHPALKKLLHSPHLAHLIADYFESTLPIRLG
jgi:hypothetical protein